MEGKVVIIAGASGALGQAVARAFAQAGASLALLDRAADRLPHLYPELASSPKHYLCGPCDATQPDQVDAIVARILDRYGRIDALANTIGGYRAGQPLHETPLSVWDHMMDLNERSAFIISKAVLPVMIAQGSGKIIHTAARAALKGAANAAAYTASKAAVIRLVESMAAEVRAKGVNVNCVLPGTIDTPANRAAMPNADHSRWVPPEAIADVFLFLASDAARAIHGAAIPVYGLS